MLLKSFMKVNAAVVIKFLVWSENDYKDPEGNCLDSFTLDYCTNGNEWLESFLQYDTLLELKAEIKSVSIWNKDSFCIIVSVKNEYDYIDKLDRKLAAHNLRPYTYIK